MDYLFHCLLHLDTYLITVVETYGAWTYLVLFAIIFCETGLIVTPFLPGDSLLFAVGSFAAQPNSPLSIIAVLLLLLMASILGNQLNYMIGRFIGPRVFTAEKSWLLNKKYLTQAHLFYEKNGGKTIVLARFLPIIRTFVPFVAGASTMRFDRFFAYNIISACLWIGCLLGFGYFFGSLPVIKENFTLVIYGIILVTLLPSIIVFFYGKCIKTA